MGWSESFHRQAAAPAESGIRGAARASAAAFCPFGERYGCATTFSEQSFRGCRGRTVRLSRGGALTLDHYRDGAAIGVAEGALKFSMLLSDGRKQIVNLQFPGEIVVFNSHDGDAHLNVEAARHATLCVFDIAEARRQNRLGEDFALLLNKEAWRALLEMQDHLLTLGRRSPPERLASFLIELDGRLNRTGEPGVEIIIPITRADIGDYLGLGSETVSRLFTQFKSRSLIHLRAPNRVVIRKRGALEEIARGDIC